jgi:hypothetical protein
MVDHRADDVSGILRRVGDEVDDAAVQPRFDERLNDQTMGAAGVGTKRRPTG